MRVANVEERSTDPDSTDVGRSVAADARASRIYLLSRRPWIAGLRTSASIAALVGLDLAGLALGLYAALVIRVAVFGPRTFYWSVLWTEGTWEWMRFLGPVTVLLFLQSGLYRRRERRPGPGRILSSLILVALVVLAFGLGTGYDFSTTGLIPTAVGTCAVTIGVLRAMFDSVALDVMRALGVQRRVVLVGASANVQRVHRQLLATRSGITYQLVGVVSDDREGLPLEPTPLAGLEQMLDRAQPDELVLTESDFDEDTLLHAVELAHRRGVRVRLAPTTTELLVHEGEYVPGHGAPLFELRPPMLGGVDFVVKRTFDVVVAGVAGVVLAPLLAVIALAIRLDSRGPVFYVDRRVGVREREFGMFKFRTMVAAAPALQTALEERNEASGALFKIRDDPRVTRVGRLLRRLSIDELPQLGNVLRGEMSLVGPRPLPLRDHRLLDDWHRARYNVLPGMTGLWQISDRSGLSFDELVRLDFTYLENWSVWLDVTIIAKTFPAVMSGRGAY